MNSREILRKLVQDGWYEVAQAGSHKQLKHPVKPGTKNEIPIGTVKSIEKQAGLKLR